MARLWQTGQLHQRDGFKFIHTRLDTEYQITQRL